MVSDAILKELFFIKNLQVVSEIKKAGQIRYFAPNEIIYDIGEVQKSVYILLKGVLYSYFIDETLTVMTDCFMTERGMPLNTFTLQVPSVFGMQALTDTEVFAFPVDDLRRMLQEHTEVAEEYMRYMQKDLLFHWYIGNKRLHLSATKKYQWFRQKWPEVDEIASNMQIASFLGIRSESLSRLRNAVKNNAESSEAITDIMVTKDLVWNYAKIKQMLDNRRII